MVDLISILIGFATLPLIAVVGLSYYALYVKGQQTVSESHHYVNTRDVETARQESVRDVELKNTEASVQDERPVPEIGDSNDG